jgi:signal transduction histidine kinase
MRHQHRRQVVDTRLPDAPVLVEGDRTRLTQVVANLVDNAMKFTPSGGTISVELATRQGHAVLVVADSGCGIDPQFLPRIFERFAQGPGTAGAGEGLGLGLAVARELVLAHHGRIEAASERAGARFTVTLPLAAPAA